MGRLAHAAWLDPDVCADTVWVAATGELLGIAVYPGTASAAPQVAKPKLTKNDNAQTKAAGRSNDAAPRGLLRSPVP